MEYGIAFEAVARDAYRKQYNCEILQVELVNQPSKSLAGIFP
jgi:hypothetical protein